MKKKIFTVHADLIVHEISLWHLTWTSQSLIHVHHCSSPWSWDDPTVYREPPSHTTFLFTQHSNYVSSNVQLHILVGETTEEMISKELYFCYKEEHLFTLKKEMVVPIILKPLFFLFLLCLSSSNERGIYTTSSQNPNSIRKQVWADLIHWTDQSQTPHFILIPLMIPISIWKLNREIGQTRERVELV